MPICWDLDIKNVLKSKNKYNHTNIYSYLFVLILTIFVFIIVLKRQSNSLVLISHDPARDVLVASTIAKYHISPNSPPYCGGCYKSNIIKNSSIYYYVLAVFYGKSGPDKLLLFCIVWSTLIIPFVFLLTKSISNKYAAIFSSIIVAFSPGLINNANHMPYQPLFLPTLSCLLVWIIIYNNKRWFSLCFLSGLLLVIGIQIHFSFVLLLPFYLINTSQAYFKFGVRKKILLIIANALFLVIFIKLNINTSYKNLPINLFSDVPDLLANLNQLFNYDLDIFFKFKYKIYIILYLIFAFVIFYKKHSLQKFLPIMMMYPIAAIYPYQNGYTSLFLPIIAVIIASLFLINNNFFIFLICGIFIIYSSRSIFDSVGLPFKKPSYANEKTINEISKKIDMYIDDSTVVYKIDGNHMVSFIGYYLYKGLYAKQATPYVDNESIILHDNNIRKILFCEKHSCGDVSVIGREAFVFNKLYDGINYSIYEIKKDSFLDNK